MNKLLVLLSCLIVLVNNSHNLYKKIDYSIKKKTNSDQNELLTQLNRISDEQFIAINNLNYGLQERLNAFNLLNEQIIDLQNKFTSEISILFSTKLVIKTKKIEIFKNLQNQLSGREKTISARISIVSKLSILGNLDRQEIMTKLQEQLFFLKEKNNFISNVISLIEEELINDNELEKIIIEIRAFFSSVFDFDLTTENNYAEVLNKIEEKFKNEFVYQNINVKIHLWNSKNMLKKLLINEDTIYLAIYINDVLINDQLFKPIVIKLINIKESPSKMIFNKVTDFFTKEFTYNEHKLDTRNNVNDVYNLVNKLIAEVVEDTKYEIDFEKFNMDGLLSSGNAVFNFNLKINSFIANLNFKIKNIKDGTKVLIEETLLNHSLLVKQIIKLQNESFLDNVTIHENLKKVATVLFTQLQWKVIVGIRNGNWIPFFIVYKGYNFFLAKFSNRLEVFFLEKDISAKFKFSYELSTTNPFFINNLGSSYPQN